MPAAPPGPSGRRTGRVVTQVSGTFRAADVAVGAEGVWVYDQNQGAARPWSGVDPNR